MTAWITAEEWAARHPDPFLTPTDDPNPLDDTDPAWGLPRSDPGHPLNRGTS